MIGIRPTSSSVLTSLVQSLVPLRHLAVRPLPKGFRRIPIAHCSLIRCDIIRFQSSDFGHLAASRAAARNWGQGGRFARAALILARAAGEQEPSLPLANEPRISRVLPSVHLSIPSVRLQSETVDCETAQ